MPLRRPVKTLKQLCLSIVVTEVSLYNDDELHDIPPVLSEELIQCFYDDVKNPSPYDVYNRNRLINKNMKKLTVIFYRTPNLPPAIDSVLRICRSLISLTCTVNNEGRENEENLTNQDLLVLVYSIPNMVILNIKAGVLDDNVLEAIGDNCPNLDSLTLELIKINNDQATSFRQRRVEDNKITDTGLIRFCHSDTQRDSKMKHLSINNSHVTSVGCLVALHDLKRLKTFNCVGVIDAFKKLFQDSTVLPLPIPTFQLSELPLIQMRNVANGTLNFIRKCCPNLTRFSIHCSDNFANDVNELKSCDQLVPLRFSCKNPITRDLGDFLSKITHLFINDRAHVNLQSIGLSCPNLIELMFCDVSVESVDQYVPSRSDQLLFNKLENLELVSTVNYFAIRRPELMFLLQNCKELEKFRVDTNIFFNNNTMKSLLNLLRRLTHFEMAGCNGVKKESILALIKAGDQLKDLTITDCRRIKAVDCREIEIFIRENNYSITTHFE